MKRLFTTFLCLAFLTSCNSKPAVIKEPAGRTWMKELHTYLRVGKTDVPISYDVFEQKMLESPDRMRQLYTYLKADSADVPQLPKDFVDKLTDGFPLPDRNLICVWMSMRNLDNQFNLDYQPFKDSVSNENYRKQFYNHIRDTNPDFTVSYEEFSRDIGFSKKRGIIF